MILSIQFSIFRLSVHAFLCTMEAFKINRPTVKYYNPATGLALIRCHREFEPLVASCLPFVTSIDKRACAIKTIHVGGVMHQQRDITSSCSMPGTIRACNWAIIEHNRALLRAVKDEVKRAGKSCGITAWHALTPQQTALSAKLELDTDAFNDAPDI